MKELYEMYSKIRRANITKRAHIHIVTWKDFVTKYVNGMSESHHVCPLHTSFHKSKLRKEYK